MRNGYAIFLLIVLFLSACKGRSSFDETVYQTVSDSVDRFSPDAKEMVLSHLSAAKDSNSYYAWLALLNRHYFLTGNDSTEILCDRVISYASRAKATPRLKRCESLAWQYKATLRMKEYASPDSVIPLFVNGYNALKESGNLTYLPWQSANIGYNYYNAGRIPEASSWMNRAFFLADSLHSSPSMVAPMYMMMGLLYTTMNDVKSAEHYYQKCYALRDSMTVRDRINFFINYSAFLDGEKRYDEIIQHLTKLRAFFEENGLTESLESKITDMNLAGAYAQTDSLDKAAALLVMDSAFRAINNQEGLFNVRTIRMQIAMRKGDMAEMDRLVATDTQAVVMPYMRYSRADIMSDYYRRKGDYKRAFELNEDMSRYQDSVSKATTELRIEEMVTRFQSDTLALRHQLLKAEKEQSDSRLHMYGVALLALAVITGLAFIIKSLRWRRDRLQGEIDNMKLRLNVARSYISPHFIYNVLNSQVSDDDPKQKSSVLRLMKLIRQNLDNARKPLVSLREELAFVDNYIDLEKSVVGKDFKYIVEAPDEEILDNQLIPSMFIQILAENAILHGLKEKQGEKWLKIKVDGQDDFVRVDVEDNGTGFDVRKASRSESGKMGLSIIRNSIEAINTRRKDKKMKIDIQNVTDESGNVKGCRSTLLIPRNLQDIT